MHSRWSRRPSCYTFVRSCNSGFFFNDTATTEIYTLSLHDALPICPSRPSCSSTAARMPAARNDWRPCRSAAARSEEHTSELQSRQYLVCRLLLEKKKAHYESAGRLNPAQD